jgi:spermidine synthase
MSARRRAIAEAVPITLSEADGARYLHFGTEWIQGAMDLRRPDRLLLAYVEQMMAWLVFLEPPARILQLGLGAGSLTRFCLRHCPESEITVVDNSAEVIETAHQWFALPREHPRLKVVRRDAQDFLEPAARRGRYGVVQVDVYDMHARAPAIEAAAFYRLCAEALSEPGIAVFNLFGEHASTERNLRRIRRAFGDRVLSMPVSEAGNLVVLGFKGPPLAVEWKTVERRAARLRSRMRLPAPHWVESLRRDRAGAMLQV